MERDAMIENTRETNASATSGAVSVSIVGMKTPSLDRRSITTRIAVSR